jgi:hypothetical protein
LFKTALKKEDGIIVNQPELKNYREGPLCLLISINVTIATKPSSFTPQSLNMKKKHIQNVNIVVAKRFSSISPVYQ